MTDSEADPPPQSPSFSTWMGSMWLYTVLRFGLFAVLWGLLYAAGLSGLIGGVLAVLLSVPLSYVLLARPRARLAATVEQRIAAQRAARAALDDKLASSEDDGSAG